MAEEKRSLGREEYQWLETLAYVFLQQSLFDKALHVLEFLDAYAGEERSDPQVLKKSAYAYLQTKQFERALGVCRRFLERWPDDKHVACIHLIHAHALLHLGRKEEAQRSLELYLSER